MKFCVNPKSGFPVFKGVYPRVGWFVVDLTGTAEQLLIEYLQEYNRLTALPFDLIPESREKGRYWQLPYDSLGVLADRLTDGDDCAGNPKGIALLAKWCRNRFVLRSPHTVH